MSTTPISPLDAPSYRTPMNHGESDTGIMFKFDEQVLGNIQEEELRSKASSKSSDIGFDIGDSDHDMF